VAGSGLDTLGGYNADPNDGDEVNGGGTNWPVWPALVVTFEDHRVLLLGEEDYAPFTGERADVIVPCPDDSYDIKPVVTALVMPAQASTYVVPAEPANKSVSGPPARTAAR
jgi:hypothetical protein